MATNGNDILIYLDGVALAATKSHEVQTDCSEVEISSPHSPTSIGNWRTYRSGRKGWTVNASYLVLNEFGKNDITDVLKIGTEVLIEIRNRQGTYTESGYALVRQAKQTYTRGNVVVGSFQFLGNGPLSVNPEPSSSDL